MKVYRIIALVDNTKQVYLIKAKTENKAKSKAIVILRKKYLIVQIILIEQWLLQTL